MNSGKRVFRLFSVLLMLILSSTSMAADDVWDFRKVAESAGVMVISVAYRYDSQHGDNVAIGAEVLKADGSRASAIGYRPWRIHQGSDRAYIVLTHVGGAAVASTKVKVKMYVGGEATYFDKTFDTAKSWSAPNDAIKPWTFRLGSVNAKDLNFSIDYNLLSTHTQQVRMGAYALKGGVKSFNHGYGPSAPLVSGTNKTATLRLSYIKTGTDQSEAILVTLYEAGGQPFHYDVVPRVKYWSNQTADADGDRISDANEIALGTNRNAKDSDGDGLEDGWELEGYHWNNYLYGDSNLPLFGANPRHKDVFVEIDYLSAADHNHKFFAPSVHRAKQLYTGLDINNSDGVKGVALHAINDEAIDYDGVIGGVCGQRAYLGHFPERKWRIYHWAMAGHGTGGQAEVQSNRFVFGTGDGTKAGTSTEFDRFVSFAVFVHELGHNLGVQHHGKDANQSNCKVNYPSLMNYAYDYTNVNADGTTCSGYTLAGTRISFSSGGSPVINENSLAEKGFWPATRTSLRCYDSDFLGTNTFNFSGTSVDWNKNGTYQDGTVSVDLTAPSCGDGDGKKSGQNDYNDAAIIQAAISPSIASPGRAGCSSAGMTASSGFHPADTPTLQPVCGIPEYRGLESHPYLKLNPVFLVRPDMKIDHPALRSILKPALTPEFKVRTDLKRTAVPLELSMPVKTLLKPNLSPTVPDELELNRLKPVEDAAQ